MKWSCAFAHDHFDQDDIRETKISVLVDFSTGASLCQHPQPGPGAIA